MADKNQENNQTESLGDSFRQARKEMWVMLGAWVVFFLWVTITCSRLAFAGPDENGVIPTLFGMPRWVAIGIAVPWLASNIFIIWFALGFMKDTPLPDHEDEEEIVEPTEESS